MVDAFQEKGLYEDKCTMMCADRQGKRAKTARKIWDFPAQLSSSSALELERARAGSKTTEKAGLTRGVPLTGEVKKGRTISTSVSISAHLCA
jgi:hypothetical protein